MLRSLALAAAVAVLLGAPGAGHAQDPPPNPHVVIETSMGDITVELFRSRATVSVVNFLTYVQAGFYDGTIFHRVIRNLIIQGGGLEQDHTPRFEGLRGPILNEATNRLQNRRGTIAMARLGTPNSARAQFFINVGHNDMPSTTATPRRKDTATRSSGGSWTAWTWSTTSRASAPPGWTA